MLHNLETYHLNWWSVTFIQLDVQMSLESRTSFVCNLTRSSCKEAALDDRLLGIFQFPPVWDTVSKCGAQINFSVTLKLSKTSNTHMQTQTSVHLCLYTSVCLLKLKLPHVQLLQASQLMWFQMNIVYFALSVNFYCLVLSGQRRKSHRLYISYLWALSNIFKT